MSYLKSDQSSVRAYMSQVRTVFLVTTASVTLVWAFLFLMMWSFAIYPIAFIVGPAYALAVGFFCAGNAPSSSIWRYILLVVVAALTQVIFTMAGLYVCFNFCWEAGIALRLLGFLVLSASGPIGTWAGPTLLNVIALKAGARRAKKLRRPLNTGASCTSEI